MSEWSVIGRHALRNSLITVATLIARQTDELLKKNLDAIGIRIVFKKDKLPELRKLARLTPLAVARDSRASEQLRRSPSGSRNHLRR